MHQHVAGQRHVRLLNELAAQGRTPRPDDVWIIDDNVVFYCNVCESLEWNGRAVHERTKRHTSKRDFLAIRAALDEGSKDKHGVSVSDADGMDFGVFDDGRQRRLSLRITLTEPNARIYLSAARLSSTQSKFKSRQDPPYVLC